MCINFVDVETEYNKNRELKKPDVEALLDWVHYQPHLPKITELQAIIFLQCCFYSNEQAKKLIDDYFTVKTICSDMFLVRNPLKSPLNNVLDVVLVAPLPKKTPEGYSILYTKFINCNPAAFDFIQTVKFFDLVIMTYLYTEEGTSPGHLLIFDMDGTTFGHMAKFSPLYIKKVMYYLQEMIPLRLKGFHFVNIVPFVDKFLALIKPFLKKELQEILYLHKNTESLTEFFPKACMPKDYGGSVGSIAELHEIWKQKVLNNVALYEWEDQQRADEKQRLGRPKNHGDLFGVEGTFKKLDLD